MRELTGDGVDIVLDGLGGALSLRSFRALRPGGRLVVFGHYATMTNGHKNRWGWAQWYTATAAVALWGLISPHRTVSAYRIQKLHQGHQWLPVARRSPAPPVGGGPRDPQAFREDFQTLLELLRADKIHPVVAERLPLAEAGHAHALLERTAATGKLVLIPNTLSTATSCWIEHAPDAPRRKPSTSAADPRTPQTDAPDRWPGWYPPAR